MIKENNIILECDFKFKCPQQWENLTVLDNAEKRFCNSCNREVFFVTTRKEMEVYARMGRCVAANVNSTEFSLSIITIGQTHPPNSSTINVFGNKEDADQLIVALAKLQRKKQQALNNNKPKK